VILKPVVGQCRFIVLRTGLFWKALRELTADHGALLTFDEVDPAFSASPTVGAQAKFGVTSADLTHPGQGDRVVWRVGALRRPPSRHQMDLVGSGRPNVIRPAP